MKLFIPIFIFFGSLSFITLTPEVSAQAGGFIPCSGTTCSACDFVTLANNIIKWLIGIIAMIFAILVMIAGFRLVTSGGSVSVKEAAKTSLTNALIGFLVVLGAWIAVDTLIRALVGSDGQVNGGLVWSEIKCGSQTASEITEIRYEEAAFVAVGGDHDVDTNGIPISGGSNCPVPSESEMVTIPGTNFKAKPAVAENFIRMKQAAAADGITLTVRSGWRSEQTQIYLWNKYNGKSAVARPCSMGGGGSNHNSGVALDIAIGCRKTDSNCNSPAYRWMKANGGRYGFNNNLPRDTVHWSPSGR